jgi:hypothetical protein
VSFGIRVITAELKINYTMTTLSHPYKDHPEPYLWPEDKVQQIEEFYEWMQTQPRFPNFSKNHAHLFLHACYYNVENSKKAMQRYVELRATAPDCFDNRDINLPNLQTTYNATQMISLPNKTKEGYRILCYRLSDNDPSKMIFSEAVKAFNMFNDVQISLDGPIEGYIVVFDMKGVRLSHLARVQFGPLRNFMQYIQEAHPVRLKKIYIVHTASFINQVMALVKPLIKSELLSLLKFSTGSPSEFFSAEYLPEDYGGTLPPIEKLYLEQRKRLEVEYKEWLMDSNALKEKPKEKNSSKSDSSKNRNDPPINSFKALEID